MRQPFQVKARFFNDRPDILVDLFWYFTDLPFIDFPTVFNNRRWDSDDTRDLELGEVFGAPRTNYGPRTIPGLNGQHVCGTPDMFVQGVTYDPTRTPVVYDADGIPTCCGRANVAFAMFGIRPAATTTQVTRPVPQLTTGSRPAALVRHVTRPVPQLTTGSRPAATVAEPVDCPIPATTCAAAGPGSLGVVCNVLPPDNTTVWRRWDVAPGEDYHFQMNNGVGTTCDWFLYEGASCGAQTLLASGNTNTVLVLFDFTASEAHVWCKWVPLSPALSTNSFTSLTQTS